MDLDVDTDGCEEGAGTEVETDCLTSRAPSRTTSRIPTFTSTTTTSEPPFWGRCAFGCCAWNGCWDDFCVWGEGEARAKAGGDDFSGDASGTSIWLESALIRAVCCTLLVSARIVEWGGAWWRKAVVGSGCVGTTVTKTGERGKCFHP
jgi:hypothetical protein